MLLTWVALILSIAALWATRVSRAEQVRLHNQLEKLKRYLLEERMGSMNETGSGRPSREAHRAVPEAPRAGVDSAARSDGPSESAAVEDTDVEHDPSRPLPGWVTGKAVSPVVEDQEDVLEATAPPLPGSSMVDEGVRETETVEARGDEDAVMVSDDAEDSWVDDAGYEADVKPRAEAKKAVSFEERLGAGVYVWAGGIALMLAGAFLVKYSFDNNLLSVRARLSIAGGFGVALVLASLWVRSRADRVAASLCGAGVAVMYAAVLSGTAHFEVMGPWVGFALMIAVTGTAVGMSLLHGPFVALLGLIGGFVTPALINGTESAWGPTFTYLLLLEIGLAVVTRKKQWFGLSAMTLAMSILSAVVYGLFAWDTDSRGWLILFVMGTAVVFVLNAARGAREEARPVSAMRLIWLGIGGLGSSALLLSMLVMVSGFSLMELTSLGVLGAGAVLLGRLDRRYVGLAFLAEGLCGMMLLAWPLAHEFADAVFEPRLYFCVAAGYGAVFVLGGFMSLWRNALPTAFAWMSAGGALGFVVLAHVGGERYLEMPWWVVYAGVAGVLTAGAGAVWRSRDEHGGWVIDAYGLTAAAMETLAIWFGLDHPWVAVAWAGLAVAVSGLDRLLGLPRLLMATGWLLAGCVLMLIVPGPTGYEMPMRLVANTMLVHYGWPTVCFAGIAWLYRGHGWRWVREVSQTLALLAGVVAVTLQIRLGFHREVLWDHEAGLIEWATVVAFWLSVCVVVLKWLTMDVLDGLRKAAMGVGVIGLIASALYLLLHANPVFMEAELGDWLVVNGLLYAYGLPCVLAACVAWVLPREAGIFRQAAGGVSLALLFALVTLEVRHGFVGTQMQWEQSAHVVLNEWATYGVALVLISLAMLWVGRWWQTEAMVVPAAIMGAAGLVAGVLGPVMLDNPLFHTADVGEWRVLNWLLYVYGLPCVLAAAVAYRMPGELRAMRQFAVGVSLVMLFVLVSFEVRHWFVGADLLLDAHPIGSAENYSYSLAWVLLALALLGGGLVTGSAALRYGSLAVMLVAVCKVALDTAQLRDLWRVLSLLGLGLSLIVLGYVYQRYVFRRPTAKEGGREDGSTGSLPGQTGE